MADEHKAKGNAAFSSGKFEEAISHFTKGIEADGTNHVLYSNRSAAQASLGNFKEALEDAKKVTELKPDWPKGYSRVGAAQQGLKNWDDAIEAYTKGLELDPTNEATKSALAEAQAGSRKAGGGMFGPEFMAKLATNPETRGYLAQPDFMRLLTTLNSNPASLTMALGDPRFQKALQVGLDMNIMTGDQFAESMPPNGTAAGPEPMDTTEAKETQAAEPHAAPAPEPEPAEDDQEAAAKREKARAQEEKAAGNAAYKAKNFDEAIARYDEAVRLDDTDISFITNRAAVHFEKGDYDVCAADCDRAVERGRELRADFKLVAKALARKGNALVKQGHLEEAVEVYHKSLTEHRNADTLKRLNDTERALKEQREKAYVNLDLSNEEKEKGNQAFKDQRYPDAVKHYTEALARGPAAVNPEAHKLHSNRAACFTKLGAWSDGLKDAEETIRLAPSFAKGYSRKAHLQYMMKDYQKAVETYEAGLAADPDNAELKEGMRASLQALAKLNRGEGTEEENKRRQARAMEDPEVQQILRDPVMQQVLDDLQNNPQSAQQHLKHPTIAGKLQKLINSGVVSIR